MYKTNVFAESPEGRQLTAKDIAQCLVFFENFGMENTFC